MTYYVKHIAPITYDVRTIAAKKYVFHSNHENGIIMLSMATITYDVKSIATMTFWHLQFIATMSYDVWSKAIMIYYNAKMVPNHECSEPRRLPTQLRGYYSSSSSIQ